MGGKESYDIVLVSPPSRMINHYRPPLGLMYIAGYYKNKGFEVKIIDVPMKDVVRNDKFWKDRDRMVEQIEDEMISQIADIYTTEIGVSCYSPEKDEVRRFIRKIRLVNPATVVVGGIHPTLYPDDMKDVAEYTHQGRLDYGYPEYSLVDMDYYCRANPYSIRGVYIRSAYIIGGFGCPGRCSFCVAPRLQKTFGINQIRKPETILQDVLRLKEEWNIDGFYFIDDLYTINKNNVKEFCRLIKPTGLLWGCSSKVSYLDEETIRIMSDANCIQMDFGVERGTDEELQQLQKDITIKQVKNIFRLCKEYHIRTLANFLIGLPKEQTTSRNNIELLVKQIQPDIVAFNRFEPYEGTDIYETGWRTENNPEIDDWIKVMTKKYNSVWKQVRWHLGWKWIRMFLRSKRKWNYISQLGVLMREVINQWTIR